MSFTIFNWRANNKMRYAIPNQIVFQMNKMIEVRVREQGLPRIIEGGVEDDFSVSVPPRAVTVWEIKDN